MTIYREVTIHRSKEENGNLRVIVWDVDFHEAGVNPDFDKPILEIMEWDWPTGSAAEFYKFQRDVARQVASCVALAKIPSDKIGMPGYTNDGMPGTDTTMIPFDFGRSRKFETKFLKVLEMDMIVR